MTESVTVYYVQQRQRIDDAWVNVDVAKFFRYEDALAHIRATMIVDAKIDQRVEDARMQHWAHRKTPSAFDVVEAAMERF